MARVGKNQDFRFQIHPVCRRLRWQWKMTGLVGIEGPRERERSLDNGFG